MGEQRERLEWEEMALEAGMDPAEVYTRRDLEERFNAAAENAIEAIVRMGVFFSLMLEGVEMKRAEELAGCAEHRFGTRLEELRLEMRRSALFLAEVG